MDPGRIIVRAVFAYVFAVILIRLSGKRVVAEATPFDFVLAIIIGDLFDDLFWAEVPAAQFVVACGTLVLLEVSVSAGNHLSPAFGRLVDGARVELVRDGAPVARGMRRERLREEEVEMLLRQKEGIEREDWPEVKSASIEKDGEPSVVKHEWARAAQKKDAQKLRGAKR
jgi:uncharacterized membrane protein YcaP (DUF421 family)